MKLDRKIFEDDDSSRLSEFINDVDNVNYKVKSFDSENLQPILQSEPPLISIAAFYGSIECFQMLMYSEADLSICDNCDRAVAHFASAGGNISICDLLDSAGVDFSAKDKEKRTCVLFVAPTVSNSPGKCKGFIRMIIQVH